MPTESTTDASTNDDTGTGTTTDDTASTGSESGASDEAKFTQADVDRIISERLKRENVHDLKAKAAKLAEIEESQKTDAQKAADRIAALEAEASKATAEALRFKVAAKHSISDEDAELFLTGTDEETLTKQAERLAGRTDKGKTSGNHVPGEGRTNRDPKADPMHEFARQVFGNNNS